MKACLGESKQEELNGGYNKNFQEHQIPDAVLQPATFNICAGYFLSLKEILSLTTKVV